MADTHLPEPGHHFGDDIVIASSWSNADARLGPICGHAVLLHDSELSNDKHFSVVDITAGDAGWVVTAWRGLFDNVVDAITFYQEAKR